MGSEAGCVVMASRFGNITRALLLSRGCPPDLVEQAMKALPVEVPDTVEQVLTDVDAAIGAVAPTARVWERQIVEDIAAAIEDECCHCGSCRDTVDDALAIVRRHADPD